MNICRSIVSAVALMLAASGAWAAGAIVVNDEEGAGESQYSFVVQATSDHEAGRAALATCRSQGYMSCVVAQRFEQCGALAVSEYFFRTGTGATIDEAERKALASCRGCRIVQAGCNVPDTRIVYRH